MYIEEGWSREDERICLLRARLTSKCEEEMENEKRLSKANRRAEAVNH